MAALPSMAECRPGCAACCIAPSITTPLPRHPRGKPAGEPCAHLTDELRCSLWHRPERPACCAGLQPSVEMCRDDRQQAIAWLTALERATQP
ncbi:MAG TPA: YkgJ family cysteine cluster protein [Accumulibacter sp.]|uniref:YkgJ family cysteine cluster protein n=1 Tax=Accumulibacter sp. TaxID=2053492 RepID=UPI0025DB6E05|nr:YkgJ family cysteine cluster protein [Accumulibacter sp.]MCM8597874.1 YkgJ family cysteine cluster protein [Accumulibacter sp.]MCM8663360.1 YkgJ family cysteine cluster protein [Accumulibacter sp.]HNC50666.1 YkgJ family cysteine cluster protein [Accumulibacter sp.]